MKRDDESGRLFIAETPTTRVRPTDRISPHRHDSELYPRLRGYLARLASLDRAEDVSSLLTMACDAVAELFDVAHLRLCTYDAEHGYTLIAERDTTRLGEPGPRTPMAEKVVTEMSDLLDWAARERKPVFFELTDEDTGRIAEPCDDEDDTHEDDTDIRRDDAHHRRSDPPAFRRRDRRGLRRGVRIPGMHQQGRCAGSGDRSGARGNRVMTPAPVSVGNE
jgi:hypothetical protein